MAPPAGLRVDAEPSPSKGARPLALLVDPPEDVRLSLRPAGGFDEQRATLHEGTRATGGALTSVSRWELAQLGDGSAAEAVALLFEALAGTPEWLRAATLLRGEPLDDMVHTEATRRLLSARRAAAMVLFEIRRRGESRSAEAQAALYRGLVQRALFCVLSDEDAGRWALESDSFTRTAPLLLGAVLAAQLEQSLGPNWWKTPRPALKQVLSGGRSLTALEAAGAAGFGASTQPLWPPSQTSASGTRRPTRRPRRRSRTTSTCRATRRSVARRSEFRGHHTQLCMPSLTARVRVGTVSCVWCPRIASSDTQGPREREGEDGAVGAGFAELGVAAVELGDGADDGEAQAGAAVAVAGGGEALEEAVADGRIDAGAVVADLGHAFGAAADLQLDALSLGRVLHRVPHQVLQRAAQPDRVAAHRGGALARSSRRTLRAAAVGPCASTASRAMALRSTG